MPRDAPGARGLALTGYWIHEDRNITQEEPGVQSTGTYVDYDRPMPVL